MSDFKKQFSWFLQVFILIYITVFFSLTILEKSTEVKLTEFPVFSKHSIVLTKDNTIYIPKLDVQAPLVFVDQETVNYVDALDQGVVHYPDSDLPGQGISVLLGHSSPPGWPKIKYDWVFKNVNDLKDGDEVLIFFQGKKYVFKVSDRYFLDKGQELPFELRDSDQSKIVLISCWPPGKDYRRIAIVAE